MCIAIAKPANLVIDEEILKTCFEANPDGAGFCVENEDGSFHLDKGYFTFESFIEDFREHAHKKALIHFRIRTHGKTNQDNCHPFVVNDETVFIHNGIITGVTATGDKSDTRVFKDEYLQPITAKYGQEALSDPIFKGLIEEFIGGSKLAFMQKGQEGFLIFNKNKGNYSSDGVWFSNYSWQKRTVPVTTTKNWSQWNREQNQLQNQTKQPRKEVNYVTAWNDDVFTFGTLVKTKWEVTINDVLIPKGSTGEVVRVYSDNTLEVDFYHSEIKEATMFTYNLDVIDDASAACFLQ